MSCAKKELGSIVNFYVTPVSRTEFLVGKQLPYVALGLLNFVVLMALAVFGFRVPFTGSILAFGCAACLYVIVATGIGLVISTFIKSQLAAIFTTMLVTIIPTTQYSGVSDPVSSLSGGGAYIALVNPATYFVTISRGTFSKALVLGDLWGDLLAILAAVPVLFVLGVALLKKQAR